MSVYVCGPRDKAPNDVFVINVTSRSRNWSRGLSPFLLGPCYLYQHGGEHLVSRTMESAWQSSKVFPGYGDENGPFESYFAWAKKIWADPYAQRYPMGKGAKPLYTWWDGKKLSYVEARKQVYVPLYKKAVAKTDAFAQLKELASQPGDLYLWDFDAYDYEKLGLTFEQALDNPDRSFGHGLVLLGMLNGWL